MDQERIRRRQSLKVIISEIIMFLSVVGLVVVLALVVSGYWLNSDFEVERQGLLQVSSSPNGANVIIDGQSSWLQRTATSKVLTSGQHEIKLTREGYDTWTKTINISEGLLYRINYPRLFLKDREKEKLQDISSAISASISPSHEQLLIINDTTKWKTINLNSEKPKSITIDVSNLFSGVSLASGAEVGLFTGSIVDITWSLSSDRFIVESKTDSGKEWVFIDIKNPTNSFNITKEFKADFSNIRIIDDSANNLIAVQDSSLRKIDIPRKQISNILVSDVISFGNYADTIVFSAIKPDNMTALEPPQNEKYYIGSFKYNDSEITTLLTSAEPIKVDINKFYDEEYVVSLLGDTITIYQYDDFNETKSYKLSFIPDDFKTGYNGEFVVFSKDNKLSTLDLESNTLRDWDIENAEFKWLDNYMIYVIEDNDLIVYDFDGLNRRVLTHNVSTRIPVTITNNKYLYYSSDGNLIREWLSPR